MKKIILAIIFVTLLIFPNIGLVHAVTEESTFYSITQSGSTYLVEAIGDTQSAVAFYDYYSSSGHTPYMEDQVSKIYLYEDGEGTVSLIIHHSIDYSISEYMRVNFDFEGIPEVAYVALSDDTNHNWEGGHSNNVEFDLSYPIEGMWEFYHNSDGGVLTDLPMDPIWTIIIYPDFAGITDWKYQETESSTIALDMSEPLIISNDLSNLSTDPELGLSFEGLTAGGSIGIARFIDDELFPSPFFDITGLGISTDLFVSKLKENGILALPLTENKMRMVTHRGIEKEHIKKSVEVIENISNEFQQSL